MVPRAQAALLIAPGVQMDLVVDGLERDRKRAVSNTTTGTSAGSVSIDCALILLAATMTPGGDVSSASGATDARQDLGAERKRGLVGDRDVDRGPGIAAIVHPVVDELGQSTRRDAMAKRVEIGFVGNRILEIRQAIARIGEELDERDAEVRRVRLGRGRIEARQQVEEQLPEARIVLRFVIEQQLAELAAAGRPPGRGSRNRPGMSP